MVGFCDALMVSGTKGLLRVLLLFLYKGITWILGAISILLDKGSTRGLKSNLKGTGESRVAQAWKAQLKNMKAI